ncbi:MAG: AEC family transporter [Ignavibacteriaceae bacterium]|nr:AEC family transporter [Ignavibacteriaceae bacterium]
MIDNIIFTANVVAPVFLLVALGYFVKKINVINENFVDVTSKFVYSVSLPALVFINIAEIDLSEAIDFSQIIYIYSATLLSFVLIWLFSMPFIKEGKNLSVFVQGAYRSNFAIVGFAIVSKLFGSYALGKAALVLAFILPLYNILAVIILTVPLRKEKKLNLKSTVFEILFNPLIIAVIVGLPFSYFKIEIPSFINLTIGFLAELALPLALIGIGGSLNLQNIKKASGLAFTSSAIKIIIVPLLLTLGAYHFGFRELDLGIMFVLFASPTAIVSFIMAEAMGANSKLAGNIVLISTVASVFTIAAGIVILKELALI